MRHVAMPHSSSFKTVEAIGRTLPDVEVTTTWGQPTLKERSCTDWNGDGQRFRFSLVHTAAGGRKPLVAVSTTRLQRLVKRRQGAPSVRELIGSRIHAATFGQLTTLRSTSAGAEASA